MRLFIQKKFVVFSTVFVMLVSLFANSGIVYAASGDTIVYLTKTGECYHSSGCSSLRKSKIETTLQSAVDRGYRPCSKCNPGTLDDSSEDTASKTSDDKVISQASTSNTKQSAVSKTSNSTSKSNKSSTSTKKKTSNKSTNTSKASKSSSSKKSSTDIGGEKKTDTVTSDTTNTEQSYVANTNTKKFHKPSCASAKKIKSENRLDFSGSRDDLINQGYDPCKNCNP